MEILVNNAQQIDLIVGESERLISESVFQT